MKWLDLIIDGKPVTVRAQKVKGVLWFHYQGETYQYVPESQGAVGQGQKAVDPDKITAPMPGKIIKILCDKGDRVSEGQTLVVMEAMKMEYNLKAARDGVIDKINCKESASVNLGDLLVELGKES